MVRGLAWADFRSGLEPGWLGPPGAEASFGPPEGPDRRQRRLSGISHAVGRKSAARPANAERFCEVEGQDRPPGDESQSDEGATSEEEVVKAIRYRYDKKVKERLSLVPGVVETVQLFFEGQRGHYGNLSVVEEPDRYVISQDPCGSMGKLWRTKSVGTTKKAYPWSWSKSGIPYYCVHCCVWEIAAIELRGYPERVTLPPEKPEDPCVRLYYKKPELIPEEYFARIGMTKTIK